MTYVPAYYDLLRGIVVRPFILRAADLMLAAMRARDLIEDKPWRLVQVTDAETGETVFRARLEMF